MTLILTLIDENIENNKMLVKLKFLKTLIKKYKLIIKNDKKTKSLLL